MCQSLMGGQRSPCPLEKDYHAMSCGSSVKYCMKLNGNMTSRNSSAPSPGITVTNGMDQTFASFLWCFTWFSLSGTLRNCGSPDWIRMFGRNLPSNGCQTVNASNQIAENVTYNFAGQVCLCDTENCNSAPASTSAAIPIVSGLLMLLFKNI